ncbi:MAG: ABC transporter ATP-binding protein [Maricaulis sp.]|nr:ABC transporter ATP-binding protein [Maricaulis sp.]
MTDSWVARLQNVGRVYKSKTGPDVAALSNINLDIHYGAFIALVGPSGSGKSTVLGLIGCLDAQTTGEVELFSRKLGSTDKGGRSDLRRQKMGFVFQNYKLLPSLSVIENVARPLVFRGVKHVRRLKIAAERLERVGLAGLGSRRPFQLSGGQQQRVAIARALASSPEMLIADEPTGALDTKNADSIIELLCELNEVGMFPVSAYGTHLSN